MSGEGWYRRVAPVTALVIGVVALLALVFPGVRDQVALSATHQPQEYVALSFDRADDDTVVVCLGTRGKVRVDFLVTSALSETRAVDYALSVGTKRTTGDVTLEPGESVAVARTLRRPDARRYDVEVRIPDADRRIVAHCGRGKS